MCSLSTDHARFQVTFQIRPCQLFQRQHYLKVKIDGIFRYLDQIVSSEIKEPIEVVTTILTIRIGCPKTVNLFNKAHQHMRGTSCTKFTLWICSFSYSMTVWLSRTHTWHKQTKKIFLLLFVINNRDNLLFTQQPWARAVQLKMSVRFYAMKFDTPKTARLHLPTHLLAPLSHSLSPSLSFTKKGCDIQGYFIFPAAQTSKLNFLNAPPSPNIARQLNFICTMRPVSASMKVSLPDGHTVISGIPLASKSGILANAAEAIKEGVLFSLTVGYFWN